ncbi:hypothetical protein ACPPVQ_05770 [Diaminobutyricibacter sp. McL0618]|uniref:hypothetical protein n=1 Tax=Leifsonia sp. McL0618 TaxID=3415677 RepID=UPI003CFAA2F2
MTLTQAAIAYVHAVCPSNKLVTPYNAALDAGNLTQLKVLATESVAANQETAKELDQGLWPEEVKADIGTVRDIYFADIPPTQQVAAAASMDAVKAIAWPDATAASTASQRLRSRLGLSADQMKGC